MLLTAHLKMLRTHKARSRSSLDKACKVRISLSLALCYAPSDKLTSAPRTTYSDPNGKTRTWEHAERRTRPKGSDIDGVGIVAILEKPDGPEILLQKQYRPPLDKIVIEIPAGLVDAGESAEQAALRELKEETGYVGTVSESSPIMFNGSSLYSFTYVS